ncbi:MAG: ketoacyl-ACP synthase III [Alphaproteobacteria bacterium]|nr:ketoacyl-ACP synthase III [Alphaproteobacteria bacterium]MBU1550100.1 ketoacyl-ACP synthase III [Alphaproteobacteria bacterium]MBU2337098.1 ketoacyl-ACP synthase III [Alphaproteobacteria bacterium]MBU2389429.1 ketoacyl-ACP synthase III [Alphaproteobacteria bacterium]
MTAILAGLGGYLPPRRVTNEDISAALDTSPEWIETRTGIVERRMVDQGVATRDLAVHAGRIAMESAGAVPIDAVIVATTSPDRLCPAVAPEVASLLGLGTVAAFDVSSACSGFVYGLATAKGLIDSGTARAVLLIGAESFSLLVDPTDRVTRPIFGDGAGAVVLKAGEVDQPGSLGRFVLGSDGSLSDILAIPSGGTRQRAGGLPAGLEADSSWYLHMEGRSVFENAVNRMTKATVSLLSSEGITNEEVDWFVGHQANSRILQLVAEEIGLAPDKVALNIHRTGNTLAASIPLLLCDMLEEGRIRPGQRVVLAAFGAGLSWGATTLTWPALTARSTDSKTTSKEKDNDTSLVRLPRQPGGDALQDQRIPHLSGLDV